MMLVVDLFEDLRNAVRGADFMVVVVDELFKDQRAGEHVQIVQLRSGRLRITLQLNGRIYLSRIIKTGFGEIPHVEVFFAHENMQVFGHIGVALFVDAPADKAQHPLDAMHIKAEKIDRLPLAEPYLLRGVQLRL
ncbi:hypothetical protein G6F32_015938 [Rhizopus arrhizus]|nr:hypothetical protein G6F32_015938 [Rhizopus arrhizus]